MVFSAHRLRDPGLPNGQAARTGFDFLLEWTRAFAGLRLRRRARADSPALTYNMEQVVGIAVKEFEDVEVAHTGFRDGSELGSQLHFRFALPKMLS